MWPVYVSPSWKKAWRPQLLRYVGSHLVILIGHLYFRVGYIARFVVKNGHQPNTCYFGIGLRAPNIDTILGSIVNTIGRADVIPLISCDVCISTFQKNSWFNLSIEIVCTVGRAHQYGRYFTIQHPWSGLNLKRHIKLGPDLGQAFPGLDNGVMWVTYTMSVLLTYFWLGWSAVCCLPRSKSGWVSDHFFFFCFQ